MTTKREFNRAEIDQWLNQDHLSLREIGRRLNCSPHTVESFLKRAEPAAEASPVTAPAPPQIAPARPDPRSMEWTPEAAVAAAVAEKAAASTTSVEQPVVPAVKPVWTEQLQAARAFKEFFDNDALFEKRFPAEAKLLADYEVAKRAAGAAQVRTMTGDPNRDQVPMHGFFCGCDDCAEFKAAGWRQISLEDNRSNITREWKLVAEPKVAPVPKPAAEEEQPPVPLPDSDHRHCSCHREDRQRLADAGWFWSLELRQWMHARPS